MEGKRQKKGEDTSGKVVPEKGLFSQARLANFFLKVQTVSISGCVGHMVSVAAPQLCWNAAADNPDTNGRSFVPINFYLQKRNQPTFCRLDKLFLSQQRALKPKGLGVAPGPASWEMPAQSQGR